MKAIQPTNEQAFEQYIERALVGSTLEERKAQGPCNPDDVLQGRYYWGSPKDFDKRLAIDTRRLWHFLHATQQQELDAYQGTDMQKDIPQSIAHEIETRGIVDVLRRGVEVGSNKIRLKLFYALPSPSDSREAHRLYGLNEFSLTRQLTFSVENPGQEIDMALFVNGLPLFTFELKNLWTGQTARKDAIRQYREDRSPHDPLLHFGRCLAHFAVDKDEVFFCTHLDGKKSYFMPFNRGLPDGQGAGNPPNSNGYRTSYLWEHTLQKNTVSDIVAKFATVDYGEAKTRKRVSHIMKNARTLIFPRYHQLDAVERLVADVAQSGVGKTYLLQHSPGAGKSNTLTWFAYKAIGICPATMGAARARALDAQLFDSAIVVTDRRLLDSALTDNIRAMGGDSGIFVHADTSGELKTAIEQGKRIISTTIQKFPYICDTISAVADKNFAIIIDEAHSSQSGKAADKMNAAVKKMTDDGRELSTEEIIEILTLEHKLSPNCSYFAFTATPKPVTLERFGTKRADGSYGPFHLYSMKQAIEEGFILDVLCNYTTYRSYCKMVKTAEENPRFKSRKAQRELNAAVEKNPYAIETKAKIIMEHFQTTLLQKDKLEGKQKDKLEGKLKGKAKAMVATEDIEHALRYYFALQAIKQQNGQKWGILIAFSGEKELDGKKFTEAGLNGFPESKTAEEFEKDENRIIVVANKYLTGFDQPKLTAMYVDKPLADTMAVQALSRLNRTAPALGKTSEDVFVLDFRNEADDIKKAFEPYYTSTSLSEAADASGLDGLRTALLAKGVFGQADVDAFSELYFKGAGTDKWTPIVDSAAQRFNKEIGFSDDEKAGFKKQCRRFCKTYARVAAIIDCGMPEWEKLSCFLCFLIPGLHVDDGGDDTGSILELVNISTYGVERTGENVKLTPDTKPGVLTSPKGTMPGAGTDIKETLDEILRKFNEAHFSGSGAPDERKKTLILITQKVISNELYKTQVVGNTDPVASKIAVYDIIEDTMSDDSCGDKSFYHNYIEDSNFKDIVNDTVWRMAPIVEKLPDEVLFGTHDLTQSTNFSS